MKQRDREVIDLYSRGFSLREVGRRLNLSIEGVRQIVRRHRPDLIRPPFDTRNNSTGLVSNSVGR